MRMIRCLPAVIIITLLPAEAGAQQKPDFSGIWALDRAQSDGHVYGQIRVITQTPSHIEMAVLHEASGQTSIIPWDLPFDRWRPRRAGEDSREPIVQSRWDGNRLVTVKAPATHYSVLWMWSLSDDGLTMTVDGISTRIDPSFDFRAASAPRGFIPNRHVYRRIAAPGDRRIAIGDALIRFAGDTTMVGVTCAADACTVIDVVAGRRRQNRTLASGRETVLSLRANTLITAARE
jgi:hypothetical protein